MHDLLKIVGNSVSNVQIAFISSDLHVLRSSLFGITCFWLIPIFDFGLYPDSVEEYARKWAKQDEVELDTLSEWVKSVKHHLKRRMYMVSRSVNTKST